MTLDEKIADAEAKLHALYTGTAVVEVDVGDGAGAYRTQFSRASIPQLEGYLGQLRAEKAGSSVPRRGAIGIWF